MEKKSLIAMTIETNALEALIQSSEGEITPELDIILTELSRDMETKTDKIGFFIKKLESHVSFLKDQSKVFSSAAKKTDNLIIRIKDMVKYSLEISSKKELVGDNYKFSLQKSKPVLEIDEEKLLAMYWKEVVTREPDRDLILARLEQGEKIDGVTLKENTALYLRTGVMK